MSQPLTVSLPPGLELSGGYRITVAALNPATGGYVNGVNINNVTLQVDQLGGGSLDFGPFMLVTGPSG